MKTGTIICVETREGFLPPAIQYFQKFDDKAAGVNNHTMLYFKDACLDMVLEGGVKQFDGKKHRQRQARVVFNPLGIYTDYPEKYKLTYLEPVFDFDETLMRRLMFKWEGTPYEFHNLLGDQIIQYLSFLWSENGWWIGRKGESAKGKVVCHELAMVIWHELTAEMWGNDKALFPEFYRARVSDMFNNKLFIHKA